MDDVIRWLNTFNAEYNVESKILHIRKPMKVTEFVYLKKVLDLYKDKIEDIIIEGWGDKNDYSIYERTYWRNGCL